MYGGLMTFNKMLRISYLSLISIIFLLLGCQNSDRNASSVKRPGKDEMADLNRYFIQKDKERIQNYIERKKLVMKESPTGLWYQILEEGSGEYLTDGSTVKMEYDCSLLDGTKCYSSQTLGPKELILGRSEMEPGMNEGLRLLKPGAKAIFIFPPYLAYGLIGDQKMIPSRAVIVYNVNILQPLK
jgi:FKBP-type peptidyl-prolyl cis-trans isomerase FkpA